MRTLKESLQSIFDVKPIEFVCLEDRIEKWERQGDLGIVVYPKQAYFNRLLISTKRAGLFEEMHAFLGMIDVVSEDEMREKDCPLYQRLKVYECEMDKMSSSFVTHNSLLSMKETINIEPSLKFVEILNSDDNILNLVKNVTPEDLSIYLSSKPIKKSGAYTSPITFYHNPTHIMWSCFITKYLERGSGFKRKICEIYDLLDAISHRLVDFTACIRSEM